MGAISRLLATGLPRMDPIENMQLFSLVNRAVGAVFFVKTRRIFEEEYV